LEIITCKTVAIGKRGDAPRYQPGIKNPVDQFPPKNVTIKNIHIDIIPPNFTNFYRQIFKIFKIMFFMDGTQKLEAQVRLYRSPDINKSS
jgi:hypothetical protein